MKNRYLILSALPLALSLLCSCSSDDEPAGPYVREISENFARTGVSYDTDGIWAKASEPVDLFIGDFVFSHSIGEYGSFAGFVASRSTETAFHDPMYLSPYCFQVCGGAGLSGSGNAFLVAFWDNYTESTDVAFHSCSIRLADNSEFVPETIAVNNTTYAYYTMLNGNDFSRKFIPGDYLRLIIHGVAKDGSEKTVRFNLADIKDADTERGIIRRWTPVDLRELGAVEYMYFTMDSNVQTEYGITVPTYFALGGITVAQQIEI